MGFRFFRRTKILPGVTLNWGKYGPSSVSFGGRGMRFTVGGKGTRTTIGIPGTGLSYTHHESHRSVPSAKYSDEAPDGYFDKLKFKKYLGVGIGLMVLGAWTMVEAPAWFVPTFALGLAVGVKIALVLSTPIEPAAMLYRAQDPEAIALQRKVTRRWWYSFLWLPGIILLGGFTGSGYSFLLTGMLAAAVFYLPYWEAKRKLLAIQPPPETSLIPDLGEGPTIDVDDLDDLASKMDRLDPIQFEGLVAMLLERMGFKVQTTPVTGDGGVDLFAYDPTPIRGGYVVVQCKHTVGVGSPDVRDLFGAMQHHQATKGILVTSGKFSQKARDWAAGKPLELIDGEGLIDLIREYQPS